MLDYYSTPYENCIIFEQYPCTLHDAIKDTSNGPLLSFQCVEIALQLLQGVECELPFTSRQ
jgi:hypothetical protein